MGRRDIRRTAPNLKIRIGTKIDLWNKVMGEVEKGRYAGPFIDPPYDCFIQSPIGLVPKDQGKSTRLIFHLSYPKRGMSVNSETPQDICKVKYPDFNKAVIECIRAGAMHTSVYSGKSDMKSAFRNLPISKLDFMLLLMKCENPQDGRTYYFVDKCLPFGASISCALFQEFSDSVAWIFKHRTGKSTVNYLDDYYFVALLKSLRDSQIEQFLQICHTINFPVSLDKTVWGATQVTFLGFLIDAVRKIVGIPVDKVIKAVDMIHFILEKNSKKATVHEIQRLCGFLNYLCRCIVPGRAFTRRLYAYTAGSLLPHHHVRITQEMKWDLHTWLKFLQNPQIYSRPFMDFHKIYADQLQWYTDASRSPVLGFGGIYGQNWFAQKWSDSQDRTFSNFIISKKPSIEYLELYAMTASILLWIHKVQNRRVCLYCDNESVVNMLKNSSSSCKNCMVLIRIITLKSLENNVQIIAKHLRSKLNFYADALSRNQMKRFYRDLRRHRKIVNCNKDHMPAEIWPIEKVWLD